MPFSALLCRKDKKGMRKDNKDLTGQQPRDEMLQRLWNMDVTSIPEQELSDALDTFRENRDAYERSRLRKLHVINMMKRAALFILPILTAWVSWHYSREHYAVGHEMLQCYVPKGKIDSLLLSDSTKVIVNAGSSIVYPSSFSKQDTCRHVYVNGNCHFAVAKDPSRPFVVDMGNLSVKVLGTHFIVDSHTDEDKVTVTLEEGLVKVFDKRHSMILYPNEQLTYDRTDGKMSKNRVDALAVNSWVKGDIDFSNQPLSEMLRILERRYNVKIRVASSKIDLKSRYTMSFKKDESIDNVMRVLTVALGNARYDKSGNTIWLY